MMSLFRHIIDLPMSLETSHPNKKLMDTAQLNETTAPIPLKLTCYTSTLSFSGRLGLTVPPRPRKHYEQATVKTCTRSLAGHIRRSLPATNTAKVMR